METHTQTEPRLHAAKVIAIAQEEWPVHCQCTSRTAPKLLCDAACPAPFILQKPPSRFVSRHLVPHPLPV